MFIDHLTCRTGAKDVAWCFGTAANVDQVAIVAQEAGRAVAFGKLVLIDDADAAVVAFVLAQNTLAERPGSVGRTVAGERLVDGLAATAILAGVGRAGQRRFAVGAVEAGRAYAPIFGRRNEHARAVVLAARFRAPHSYVRCRRNDCSSNWRRRRPC